MSQWIAGLSTGHNAGVCLLKDGEIIFSIEEERLSKTKHDGGPILSLMKILEYTDKIDYLVVTGLLSHPDSPVSSMIEYSGEPLYQGIARRLGLIEQSKNKTYPDEQLPQVINMFNNHHQLHSAIAFYNSGFKTATSVIVDSSGSCEVLQQMTQIMGKPMVLGDSITYFETESFYDCSYQKGILPIYRKMMSDNGKSFTRKQKQEVLVVDEGAGIGKVWDSITNYCGFHINESGKTMGLSAYGCENDEMPDLFIDDTANKDLVKAYYPYRAELNMFKYDILNDADWDKEDLSNSTGRRNMAFKVQKETQEQVLNLILKASEMSNNKNIVLSGGYALNCVSNYYYLDKLKEHDIHLYVEPNSSDAGTATGAALLHHYNINKDDISKRERIKSLYLGPDYNYNSYDVLEKNYFKIGIKEKYDAQVIETSYKEIAELIKDKNIVSIFQGRSENGPRALGNRSILFNPTVENGKDLVNKVKRREYFRPFAASIMKEYAHDWFDMKGLKESPNMMYAVDVKEDKKDLIPAVLHVDDTCRIQTVTKENNEHFYNLIEEFYNITGIPLLFNTSLNLAGDPLAETLDDVMKILSDSEMKYCYMPELNNLIIRSRV